MPRTKRYTHPNPRRFKLKLKTKKLRLTGDERFWIQHRIEQLKVSERTEGEKRLLAKVR